MFRWCFIGTGRLANIVAKEILKSGRHEIVSCYSRNPKARKTFSTKYHCAEYADAAEAMNDERVDAIYIVTPHNVHFSFAKEALLLKRPVLLEKPFTVDEEETKELISLAKQNDVFLAEAMWTWYHGASLEVKDWISHDEIGKIKSARFTYHLNSVHYASRVADPKRAGGALLDITVYPIAYAYQLFGMPLKIESKAIIENGIDLIDEIKFFYEDGMSVDISTSIIDYKGLEKARIYSEKGMIKINSYHHANRATLKMEKKKIAYHPQEKRHISYIYEFDEVASCVNEGRKESIHYPLKSTLDVMHIIKTVKEQINLNYPDLEK